MIRIRFFLIILLMFSSAHLMNAQFILDGRRPFFDNRTKTYLLPVPEDYFGKPCTLSFVPDDSISWVSQDAWYVTDKMYFRNLKSDTTYTFSYWVYPVGYAVKLRFTSLPVVKLVGDIGEDYTQGEFWMQVPEDTTTLRLNAKIKWAGSSTNRPWFKKHNYHLKFQDENHEKMEVSFYGLRKDNHWRIDGGVIDFSRVRNKVSHELWADMAHKPYYADVQPNARSYCRSFFIDLFDNQKFKGFVNLAEYMDRKQMKLKKYDDATGEFHGMLWKAKDASWQTLFAATAAYDNTSDYWCGFEMEYPDLDDVPRTDYHILSNAISFVVKSTDTEFRQHVGEFFDLPVLVDYYVFINVLLASDNVCKNILWACYDGAVDKKLTLAVWDLDAVMGQYWSNDDEYYHGPVVAPENNLGDVSRFSDNRLFNRLMEWDEFRNQVNERYWQLRRGVLSPNRLIGRFSTTFDDLRKRGAIYREEDYFNHSSDLSGRELNFANELEYLSDWIQRRIDYLDHNTFAIEGGCVIGDVDGDGEVTISDVVAIIEILLGKQVDQGTLYRSDMDQDGEVRISDVNTVIDYILTR